MIQEKIKFMKKEITTIPKNRNSL